MSAVQQEHFSWPWENHYPEGLDWRKTFEARPLYNLLDDAAAQYPKNHFLDFMGKKWNYETIAELVQHAASGLQSLGVTKDTRVGLFLPNTPYFIIFYYAILKAGGIVVNYNPLYAEREVEHLINDSHTEIMITMDLKILYDKIAKMLGSTALKKIIVCSMVEILPFPKNVLFPILKRSQIADVKDSPDVVMYSDVVNNSGLYQTHPVSPERDVAVIQYTGGTTGTPKGAMLSHANLYINALQTRTWFVGVDLGKERSVAVLPLFHVYAMTTIMNFSISIGAEIILLPKFELIELLKCIDSKKPTFFMGVPTIYNAVINHPQAKKYNLSSIKACISGGAALPVEVKKSFESMTGCKMVEGYGLSESSPLAVVNPLYGDNIPGSIGVPVPQTIVEIVSLEDRKTVMPVGENGEVCLRGPQIMMGYWNKPEETAQTLVQGRLHTGDVGYMDERGYTYIVDRIKDVIIAGGYKIFPRNVEEAMYLHPHIAECIVIGVPDEYRGETVKAYIKLAPNTTLTLEEIKSFLHDKLSPIEIPKYVEFRDELPKTLIGKLSRKALREELEKTS